MQNSTETPRTIASQYTQNNVGSRVSAVSDSESGRVFGAEEFLPRMRNIRIGENAMSPNAQRQPIEVVNHPTRSGAAVASNEAITFASESATARISPC